MSRHLPILSSRIASRLALPPRPEDFGKLGVPALRDEADRTYNYMRLSVTDRCDLACRYCMPVSGEEEHAVRRELLTFEEARRIIDVFGRMGIRRVRLTGGEPLVRKGILRLVEMVGRLPQAPELVMTTNATRLAELAAPLAQAGLSGVNISLDSLRPDRFLRLTRGGDLARVRSGIHAALQAGLRVKLNTVILAGENEDEFGEIVDYAWSLGITPRFIELMPLGGAEAQRAGQYLSHRAVVAALGERISEELSPGGEGVGPARYRRARDGSGRQVGFITPMSDEFCGSCNRIRVTAQGDIRACLASRRAISLRDILRRGGDDLDLAWAAHWSLQTKSAGHGFNDLGTTEYEHVGMSLIGG